MSLNSEEKTIKFLAGTVFFYFLISYSGKLASKDVKINYNRVNVYKSNNVKALTHLYPFQRRAKLFFRGWDKNQDFGIVKNWVKQESRILKSSRISVVKNQDFFSNFLDFKQESRNVKLQFLISSGSQDLKFGNRKETQARTEIF